MRASRTAKWRFAMAGMAVLVSTSALTLATPSPAYADPGCQNNGVYILWARGTDAPIGDTEADRFQSNVESALSNAGVQTHAWAELGNLDNNGVVSPDTEYPAYHPLTGRYSESVNIGADELVTSLNRRYALGPYGYNCTNETVVLGGHSQGADVIGTALARTGANSLTSEARRRIGFAGFYGDPSFDSLGCPKAKWTRGDSICGNHGIFQARNPYVTADFLGRLGSWCDDGDGYCNGSYFQGNHGSIYETEWIPDSMAEIVNRVLAKRSEVTANIGSGVGNATFDGRNFLRSSDAPNLLPNHYIMSSDARFVLILQPDGNLVLYGPGYIKKWESNTDGQTVSHLAMQSDGRLVLRGPNNEVRWQSFTSAGPSHLSVQNDGNAVIYTDPGGAATWQSYSTYGALITDTGSDYRGPNEYLYANMYIQSPDGRYTLLMQPDGNLVLYGPGGHPLWNAGVAGAGNYLVMQPDGNLVVRSPGGAAIWHITMNGGSVAQGGYVRVQNDGNLVVYATNGGWTWQSYTAGLT